MKGFVIWSALLCVALAQQGYPRGGPGGFNPGSGSGFSSGGGNRGQGGFSSGGGNGGYSTGGPNGFGNNNGGQGGFFTGGNGSGNRPGGLNGITGFGIADDSFSSVGYPDSAESQNQALSAEAEEGAIPGTPGVDYPTYDEVPQTSFTCSERRHPGYYADPEAQCQAFYICQGASRQDGFLCPNGTLFHPVHLVCEWWFQVKDQCRQALEIGEATNEGIIAEMAAADQRLQEEREAQAAAEAAAAEAAEVAASNGGYGYTAPLNGQASNNGFSSPSGRPSSGQGGNRGGFGAQNDAPSSSYGAPFQGAASNNGVRRPGGNRGGFGAQNDAPSNSYGAPFQVGAPIQGAAFGNGVGRPGGNRGGFGAQNDSPSSSYGAPFQGGAPIQGAAFGNGVGRPGGNRGGFGAQNDSPSSSYGAPFQGAASSVSGNGAGRPGGNYLPPSNGINRGSSSSSGSRGPFGSLSDSTGSNGRPANSNRGNGNRGSGSGSRIPSSQYGAPFQGSASTVVGRPGSNYLPPSNGNGRGSSPSRGSASGPRGNVASASFLSTTTAGRPGQGFSSPNRNGAAPSSQYGAPFQGSASNDVPSSSYLPATQGAASNNRNTFARPSGFQGASSNISPARAPANNFGSLMNDFLTAPSNDDPNFTAPSGLYGAPSFGNQGSASTSSRSYLPPSK